MTAQHIPINEFNKQLWYDSMISTIKTLVNTNKERIKNHPKDFSKIDNLIMVLPNDYRIKKTDKHVISFRPNDLTDLKEYYNMKLDNEDPLIMVNQCDFEIHLDKDFKINEVYVPL